MPSLSQIQSADVTAKVVIDFGGTELNLLVYPNRITGKRTKEMQALGEMTDEDMPDALDDKGKPVLDDEGNPVKAYTVEDRAAELLFDVIKSWDLTDDDGVPLPFDANTQDLLAIPTMTRIYTEIGESTNPNPKTGRRSRSR